MDLRSGVCRARWWLMGDSSRQALETPSSDFNTEELSAARGCPLGWHTPTPWHNNGKHCYFCFYKGSVPRLATHRVLRR